MPRRDLPDDVSAGDSVLSRREPIPRDKVDVDDPGDVFFATHERGVPSVGPISTPALGAPMLALLAALLAGVAWLARGIVATSSRRR